jgi:hypothetical protein
MNDYQQRQVAVQRYILGEKVAVIARSLGKSRKWVHHWVNRYNQDPNSEHWFEDNSKAPKKANRSLPDQTEHQILLVRNELAKEKMSQIGAISIQYEFERRGLKPVPEVWTINRVIAKHGLNKQKTFVKTPREYPDLYVDTHQMDLVGPRYIKGDGRFYSVNLIDVNTHACYVKAVRSKSADGIVEAIASFWQIQGMPDALQMDNELAFRGSNRYPRSFGRVVRFALSQGVAPVFIPVKEPWRNGIIEKFNDTYQKKFIRAYEFTDFDDLLIREKSFMDFHNTNHRYSSQAHKTPNEMKAYLLPPIYYRGQMHLQHNIPLTEGCIYFIRFIRSDLIVNLPNEAFKVPAELKYSYVIVEISTVNHSLIIRQDGEIKKIFSYHMPVDW